MIILTLAQTLTQKYVTQGLMWWKSRSTLGCLTGALYNAAVGPSAITVGAQARQVGSGDIPFTPFVTLGPTWRNSNPTHIVL